MSVPSWVIDGWYSNNPEKQRMAIARYHQPVISPSERARIAAIDVEKLDCFPCSSCGKFAFAQPSTCFWCRQ
jgi:hypothetical protein